MPHDAGAFESEESRGPTPQRGAAPLQPGGQGGGAGARPLPGLGRPGWARRGARGGPLVASTCAPDAAGRRGAGLEARGPAEPSGRGRGSARRSRSTPRLPSGSVEPGPATFARSSRSRFLTIMRKSCVKACCSKPLFYRCSFAVSLFLISCGFHSKPRKGSGRVNIISVSHPLGSLWNCRILDPRPQKGIPGPFLCFQLFFED